MGKFAITVNSNSREGFKLNFHSDSQEKLKIYKELSEKLIEKVTKIEISIKKDEEY